MQSQTGQNTQCNPEIKCLDIKKLYFRVQVRRQIHTCIPVPKKSNIRKNHLVLQLSFFLFLIPARTSSDARTTGWETLLWVITLLSLPI
jgi:hypothetical protein